MHIKVCFKPLWDRSLNGVKKAECVWSVKVAHRKNPRSEPHGSHISPEGFPYIAEKEILW